MIARFLVWLFFAIIGIVVIVVLLPLILLLVLFVLIVSLFSRSTARIWTSRAQAGAKAGAQTVRSTINQHAPSSMQHKKPGQRKSKVIDADVIEIVK